MNKRILLAFGLLLFGFVAAAPGLVAQPPRPEGPPPGGPRGPGGPGDVFVGGPMAEERQLVKQFDKDGDKRLNLAERQAAREFIKKERESGGGPRGFGPRGFGRGNQEPAKPGPKVTPADVQTHPQAELYEPTVLRTFFLEFENPDWEAELADFKGTDVEVPATLTVDGKQYPSVGVHFRGTSSYGMVPAGYKRSLNLTIDFADKKQRLYGYRTLNLLNAHEDASLMSTVLYSHLARQHIPAPKANFVTVVINGESWGVYANAQQFNTEFLKENFKSSKGTRWKIRPGGGGIDYLGDNVEDYKRRYQIKSGDNAKGWQLLMQLCKTLNQTPPEKLEEALKPLVDLDGLLWFLALDVALINNDGYWIRASDFSLFLDEKGKFHFIPSDMNEAFRPAMGFGFGGPMRFGGGNGEVLPGFQQDQLSMTESQKKQVAELQKDVESRLDKILTPEQRKQLKDLRERGPGGFVTMAGPGGPGGRGPGGPPGAGGPANVELDPLVALTDARKPLRSKILAVPALKERYLSHVRTIAAEGLDWKKLGPVVNQYRKLIEKTVETDTRKLDSFDAFQRATAEQPSTEGAPGRMPGMNLRAFAEQRSKYLLNHAEIKKLGAAGPGDARKGGSE